MNIAFRWSDQKITGWIYFIQYHPSGPIKIGYAHNIDHRLTTLQIACPYDLEVVCRGPGNVETEKFIHNYLFKCGIRGEWFWPVAQVQQIINRLNSFEHHYPDYNLICRNIIKEKLNQSLFEFYGARPIDIEFGNIKQEDI